MTERTRSPEFRLAHHALQGLRADLFHDAFAYRPLPPLPREGDGWAANMPGRSARYAVWLPHGVVVALAAFTLFAAYAGGFGGWDTGGEVAWALTGLLPAGAVLLTMVRPVLAWWCSLVMTPFVLVLSGGAWAPWAPGSIAGHTAVMAVVAARTRPRTAGWMWVLTAVYSLCAETTVSWDSNTADMLAFSGVVLALVAMATANRHARREVVAERTVTAVERDRRTLLEERTTIARELHDVVAHHMSVVAIQAEAAPYRVENPPPELAQAFATIRENAVVALTELRRVLGVVRAEDYEAPDAPQPTLADLDRLLDNVRETGLSVEKVVTGAVRELPQGVELSAYRIVQEALSNSLRHAPGAAARVEIGYVLGGLGLRVVNGPPTGLRKPSPGAGHGITGMRERVAMLDGEMTAEATADGGYEVTVFLPVPLQAAAAATGPVEGEAA
ncbi:histidine kinase [Streptomyces sp. CC224B]|uniref:sensor histidine kinase n=1 Tax=Streptomyces sp. CC224B TaxID=3044571 RepID=UPI0024A87609|nr:histidine kinase [Streptomyces sp. CC224B]